MTWLRVLALASLFLLVSACAARQAVTTVATPSIPQTESECSAHGGHWTTLGLQYSGKPKGCDLETTDSGKLCSDSSECQGSCVAPEGVAAGLETSGTCSAYVSNFGKLKLVEHGRAVLLNVE